MKHRILQKYTAARHLPQSSHYFSKGSGYRSVSGFTFFDTYSSTVFKVIVTHDDCAVDCTTLVGRNVLNLNPKH